MDDDLDATRIRELLLDFYGDHDPQRLNMGLDIFSIVIWTQSNGIEALNDLLDEQYNARIDPDKKLGGTKAAFKRFSTLMSNDEEDETAKRNHIYEKLVEFYEVRDPSKIGRLNDFVQYIVMHGIDAFNRKLFAKYGEGISLDDSPHKPLAQQRVVSAASNYGANRDNQNSTTTGGTFESETSFKQGGGAPAPTDAEEPKSRYIDELDNGSFSGYSFEDEEAKSAITDEYDDMNGMDLPPPPPFDEAALSEVGSEFTTASLADMKGHLRSKLTGYYAMHDPGKLDHVEAIVEWGMQIGEDELEGKLTQIYGTGFNRSPRHGGKTPPAQPARPNGYSFDVADSSNASKPKPPAPTKKKGVFASAMRKSVRALGGAPKQPERRNKPSPPQKPRMPQPPQRKGSAQHGMPANTVRQAGADGGDGPCNSYQLDMSGATFGVCNCGFSRQAHAPNSEARRAAASRRGHGHGQGGTPRYGGGGGGGGGGSPRGAPRAPVDTTGTFLYKTTAATKTPVHVDVRAGGGEKGGVRACNNFRLDMTGTSYGVCECGFPRDQHNYRGQLEAADQKRGVLKRVSKRFLSK